MGDLIFGNRGYYFISMCLIVLAILMFILMFEKRKPRAREIVILAVMITLAVISRTIFFMAPQFKPMAAVIVIAGVAFGKQSGFLCGALSAFISNIFFGQGPWTPWQMIAFGLIGFLAGVIFHKSLGEKKLEGKDVVAICVYSCAAIVVLYGLIMDTATVVMSTDNPKVEVFLVAYGTGFIYNIIHAASTVLFLVFLAEPMLRKINRIKNKFGMFQECKSIK